MNIDINKFNIYGDSIINKYNNTIEIINKNKNTTTGIYYETQIKKNTKYRLFLNYRSKYDCYINIQNKDSSKVYIKSNILLSKNYYFSSEIDDQIIIFLILDTTNNNVLTIENIQLEDLTIIDNKIIQKPKFLLYDTNKLKENNNFESNQYDIFEPTQIYISPSLKQFERIRTIYNLELYEDNKKPVIIFGIYKNIDRKIIRNHQGPIYILWGGTDINLDYKLGNVNYNFIRTVSNIKLHYSISDSITNRLQKLNITNYKQIYFNLVDRSIFKPLNSYGDSIYIYDGYSKNNSDVYGGNLIKEIINRFPEFKFIRSSTLNCSYEEMINVYRKIFLGIRLTKEDGNANTVQELEAMNIPIIHNSNTKVSLKWNTIDDVELHVRYRQLDLFEDHLQKSNFNNILILCEGYCSYGGASTNSYLIGKYLNYNLNKNVKVVFYTDNKDYINKKQKDKIITVIDKNNLKNYLFDLKNKFQWNPDLIILRNYIDIDIKSLFNCPIYFFIPGIFNSNLNKNYLELTEGEIKQFIHNKILDTIAISTKSFCANYKSIEILKKTFGLDINLLYFNLFSYKNKFFEIDNNFNNRTYYYGVIISDFDRVVKNIPTIINFLNKQKYKTILIGKNSHKYKSSFIDTYDLLPNYELKSYYKKIKYIITASYYESYSNVILEAKFNGCSVIDLLNDQNQIDQNQIDQNQIDKNDQTYIYNEQVDIVGIYKVNPNDNENENINDKTNITKSQIKYSILDTNDKIFNKIFTMDIYLNIFVQINKLYNFDTVHYIYLYDQIPFNYGINQTNKKTLKIEKIINNVKVIVWILEKYEQIYNFSDAKVYFLRGEYHKLYSKLCSKNSYKIFYPAVSLIYTHTKKDLSKPLTLLNTNKTLKKTDFNYDYDLILSHEDKNITKKYGEHLNYLLFKKWANKDNFNNLNIRRIYEFIIVASSKQPTKNHKLFFDFLKYYDNYIDKNFNLNNNKILIAYVSNKQNLTEYIESYKCLNIVFFNNLNPSELNIVYNKSRINLIFSGRDCCPRVISEAGNCGCYNICVDTLSDGKFYYKEPYGVIINSDTEITLEKSKSISYKNSNILWDKIINHVTKKYNHDQISEKFIEEYNENKFVDELNYKINNITNKRILITCTQYPHYGGSATTAYHTTKFLRKCGYNVVCLFFENRNINIDPENLGNIIQVKHLPDFIINPKEDKTQIKTKIETSLNGIPNIILGFNYGAPILIRQLYKTVQLIYCISGLPTLTLGTYSAINNNLSVQTVLNKKNINDYLNNDLVEQELRCIKVSNYCSPYSSLITDVYKTIYPQYLNKLIEPVHSAVNNILLNQKENQILNTDNKYIDLIAVASNWKRSVKNYKFLTKIFELFPNKNKLIIGEGSNHTIIPNTTYLNHVSYDQIQYYLSVSKIVVICSLSESGPNILLEGLNNRCIPIASKNIGFQYYLNSQTLCEDVYNKYEYYDKITYLLNNFYLLDFDHLFNLNKYKFEEKNKFINVINNYSNINKYINTEKTIPKILFISCDIPYVGGAATNTYNLIKELKTSCKSYGLFVSNLDKNLNPDNIDNIYQLKIDNNIEENFLKILKSIDVNICFFKNYKIYSYLAHLITDKIKIFSPSGLRFITSYISKTKKFYKDINHKIIMKNMKNKSIIYDQKENILDFVKKNDQYLENYVFNDCDYILPNSSITYDLIKKYNNFSHLLNPIYLTNINYNKFNIHFESKTIDIVFIAYDWQRECKNYNLVKELLNSKHIAKLNIVSIGKNQIPYSKILQYDNLNKTDLNNILKKTKTVIIPSYYDSNPNVLIEAVSYNCNIVTSSNVGNSEFISKELLVHKYNDQKEWRKKIYLSLTKQFYYNGFDKKTIIENLLSLFNNFLN